MELPKELVHGETGFGKNASTVYPNRGSVQEELRKAHE